ncbi:DUF5666 domain-containing protein [Nitrosomonas sp. Nm33]|uniref:DUF5666 domain-containing protein n=1 Tax=Nitrosomonas sp. Nm33 TaxID=133724 RepID=UPI000898ADD2|nr:DUF5666 domain-containing protein [Nitrosomonas sp. Nm33]SDY66084.1 hypothetical protein SAMN05421755_103710 [Nitrosomonas sp. Nm33]
MRHFRFVFALFSMLTILAFSSLALSSESDELEFRATVLAINMPTDGDSTITVRLITENTPPFEGPIVITGATEIESNGFEIPLSELQVGDIIKVEAFFGANGMIIAKEIEVLDAQVAEVGRFRVQGAIQQLTPVNNDVLMRVIGIDILVNASTIIRTRELRNIENLLITSLRVGDIVDVRGRFVDNRLVADRIEVGERPDEEVKVKGTIVQLNNNTIVIAIDGANLTVIRTESTDVRGNLAMGMFIEVEGFLDKDLHIIAEEIKVDDNRDGNVDDDHDFGRKKDRDDDRFGRDRNHNGGRDDNAPGNMNTPSNMNM